MSAQLIRTNSVVARLTLRTVSLALLFVCIAWPVAAMAQDAADDPVKPCTSCHTDEAAAWQASSHGMKSNPDTGEAAAACTSCHGDYVRGHPDEALTPLRADSSSCMECHAATFQQWEASIHGEEGVQCISCHQPHSQEMRLTDEAQCTACHRESLEDPLHEAHWQAEAACTDCHMAEMAPGAALAMASAAGESSFASVLPTTNHDFVTVSAAKCLDCHADDVALTQRTSYVDGSADSAASVTDVEARLESARQTNRSLTIFSLANLGFGLGMGGVLGIVFMVVMIRFGNRPSEDESSAKENDRE
jgi:hypothetical protein